jgi:8-oxo-dGTP pyrophosphatase MutT (NUDIX family)
LQAALREVAEEIGVELRAENGALIHTEAKGSAIYDIYLFRENVDLAKTVLQNGEVCAIKLVPFAELEAMAETGEIAEPLLYHIPLLRAQIGK